MKKLKNTGEQLSKDVENIIQNYLKLFGLKQSETLAVFMGLISTAILITTLLLILIVFCSFILGGFLNNLFQSDYLGYGIISGIYALIIIILLLRIKKKGAPLLWAGRTTCLQGRHVGQNALQCYTHFLELAKRMMPTLLIGSKKCLK